MSNIKVVYKNELNLVPMRNFKSAEMDLFFAICSKMKNKTLDTVRFDFEQLKELSNYKPTSLKRFADDLEHTYDKMLQLTFSKKTNKVREKFVLFTSFKIDEENRYVDIKVNSDFEYILNQLENEFTKFELEQFTEIRSSYAKTMYRLLKQYRQTGFYKVKIEDFRELLDIPESYPMHKIDSAVLKPIKKELANYFSNLQIKKIKAKKGNKIALLEFYFTEQKNMEKVPMHNWLDGDNNG